VRRMAGLGREQGRAAVQHIFRFGQTAEDGRPDLPHLDE